MTEALNRFLVRFALQNQQADVRTFYEHFGLIASPTDPLRLF